MKRMLGFILGMCLLGVLFAMVAAVQLGEPTLPRTELDVRDLESLVRAYSDLERARPDPARVDLTLNQASYLLERNPPDDEWFGWSTVGMSLESSGEQVLMTVVLEGPLGLYSRMTVEGILRLAEDEWTMYVDRVHLGYLPLTPVVSDEWTLDLPVEYLEGRLRLLEAEVDGSGIRALVTVANPVDEAPGLDVTPEEDPIGDLL